MSRFDRELTVQLEDETRLRNYAVSSSSLFRGSFRIIDKRVSGKTEEGGSGGLKKPNPKRHSFIISL